ncbi:MAG: hypothetical protein AAFQ45_14215 [Pseudomonadota bacterium]
MSIATSGIIKLNGDVVQLSCSGCIATYEARLLAHRSIIDARPSAEEFSRRMKRKAGLERPKQKRVAFGGGTVGRKRARPVVVAASADVAPMAFTDRAPAGTRASGGVASQD